MDYITIISKTGHVECKMPANRAQRLIAAHVIGLFAHVFGGKLVVVQGTSPCSFNDVRHYQRKFGK